MDLHSLSLFTGSICNNKGIRHFVPGNPFTSSPCASGSPLLITSVRGTVTIVLFGLRNRLIDHGPGFGVDSEQLLSGVSFRGTAMAINRGGCPVSSAFFPAISRSCPCRLAGARGQIVRRLGGTFVTDRGLGERVSFLFTGNKVCRYYGGGLLLRNYVPVGGSNDFVRFSANGYILSKGTLLSRLRGVIHRKRSTPRGSPRERGNGSCV